MKDRAAAVALRDTGAGQPDAEQGSRDDRGAGQGAPIWQRAWFLAVAGALALWAAFPPLDLWPLAFAAPLPWLLLVRQERLSGWRPYWIIWLGAFLHWLLMLQGIRLAHWALYFGWLALAAFVACYTPVFVAIARVAVHRLRVPLVVAAPVAWVGIELIRGHVISGFSMGLLGHTQVRWTTLLQVSDVAGAYGVSFVVMFVAACAARMVPWPDAVAETSQPPRWAFWPAIPAAAVLAMTLGYGAWRMKEDVPGADAEPVKVALIQGSLDTVFEMSPERIERTFTQYGELTTQVREAEPELDLVVWPESMFPIPELRIADPLVPPPEAQMSAERFRERLVETNKRFTSTLEGLVDLVQPKSAAGAAENGNASEQDRGTSVVIGTNTFVYSRGEPLMHNSAVLARPGGEIAGRYYKMHAVMCGEYLPLGSLMPWVYRVTPMSGGLTTGVEPEVFEVAGQRFSPSICFESTVPHLLRRQVNRLSAQSREPDVLLNVTNDGWFWGSSILDLHFRCAVFRAIENRKPMVIAANTGFSAWIDGRGTVVKQGPRRATATLVAHVRPDGRRSPYGQIGDWPAGLCAAFCWVVAGIGVWRRG